MKQAITVTPEAALQAEKLIASRGKPTVGIRIGVRTRGCSGLSYTIEYADDVKPFEEVVTVNDHLKVIIDPKAVMFLLGTTMIYQEDKFKSGFEFVNPNEKGRCGCGESFTV
jgi:iron-sulfur cluster assembly protein